MKIARNSTAPKRIGNGLKPMALGGVLALFSAFSVQAEIVNTVSVTGTFVGQTYTATDSEQVAVKVAAPSIQLQKSSDISGLSSPVVPGDIITYTFRIENDGNVSLFNIGLTDARTNVTGSPIAKMIPAQVDDTTFTASYVVTQADIDAGKYVNQAFVTANTAQGVIVDKNSDDPVTSGIEDPTTTILAGAPSLQLTKYQGVLDDANGNGRPDVGETLNFAFRVENTGNVTLTNVSLADPTSTVAGGPIATLTPGGVDDTTFSASYVLTKADIDAGGMQNSATALASTPNETDNLTDISDSAEGTEATETPDLAGNTDGDPTNDPTVTLLQRVSGLEVVKTSDDSGLSSPPVVGDKITYLIQVTNTGNTSLANVVLDDTFADANQQALSLDAAPELVSGDLNSDGILDANEIWEYAAEYTLAQSAIDAGGVTNMVKASATNPESGTTEGEIAAPVVNVIDQVASLDLMKSVVEHNVLFQTVFETTFDITATNTGNVTESDIHITDDLAAFIGQGNLHSVELIGVNGFKLTDSPNQLATLANNGNVSYDGLNDTELFSDGLLLAPSEQGSVLLKVTYEGTKETLGGINTAVANAIEASVPVEYEANLDFGDADGDGYPDNQESSAKDRDGDGIVDAQDYDPTGYFYCEEDGRILSGGRISVTGPFGTNSGIGLSNNINIVQDGSNGFFQFFVTAPGHYSVNYTYPSSGIPSTSLLISAAPLDVTNAVDVYTGLAAGAVRNLGSNEFGGTGVLANYSAAANPAFYASFDIEAGDPTIFGNNVPLRDCAAVSAPLIATKTADKKDVVRGETVTYTLSFENPATGFDRHGVDLVDVLPAGVLYSPGATLNGAPLEPLIAGNQLNWNNRDLLAGSTTTVTYSARVTSAASSGDLHNRASVYDPVSGKTISNVAIATVRLRVDALFECSDIIGRVFDDLNADGYPDQGELGLAGSRVVTARGDLITTDEHGRFHVPCAALPKDIGSNFILKLDTRSLPVGYAVTSENPRVVRLTAGKFAKINFGASIMKRIEIELDASAFTSTGALSEPLKKALTRVAKGLKGQQVFVELIYKPKGEAQAVIQANLKRFEKAIQQAWRRSGGSKVQIEKTIWSKEAGDE